jgi:AcrR family transcriptional regulator
MAERKSSDSRQKEIVDAALKIIAGQGLTKFTAQTIAREIGVSDAALFRHFPSKEAIVMAAIERIAQGLEAGLAQPAGDPLEQLGRFFQHRSALMQSTPGVARLIVSELLAQVASPEGVARIAQLRRRSVEFIRHRLEDASRQGLLADGVGVEEATVITLGALMALTQGSTQRARSDDLSRGVWATLESLFRGRRPRRSRRPRPTIRDPSRAPR